MAESLAWDLCGSFFFLGCATRPKPPTVETWSPNHWTVQKSLSGYSDHSVFYYYLWLSWVCIAMRAFSSCSSWWLLFLVAHSLTVVASLGAEHGLWSAWAS